jgi:hypothetical protein
LASFNITERYVMVVISIRWRIFIHGNSECKLYTFLGLTMSSCVKCNHVGPEAVILKIFLYENGHIYWLWWLPLLLSKGSQNMHSRDLVRFYSISLSKTRSILQTANAWSSLTLRMQRGSFKDRVGFSLALQC